MTKDGTWFSFYWKIYDDLPEWILENLLAKIFDGEKTPVGWLVGVFFFPKR